MPEFRVLGPLMAAADGECRALPGKERALLAALLLQPGRIVPTESLIDVLWDTDPPTSARNTVQWHVKQLRRLLGPQIAERIITRAPGYLIEVRPGELDLDNFSGLADRGRSAAKAGDWERAADLLAAALTLWCGDPLSGVPSQALRRSEVPRLTELRTQAQEARIEADLHAGRHQEVTAELRKLVATQPYRERTWAQLMLALYRSDRQGEALDAYRRARSALRDELGIEPGSELERLYQRILAGDPALTKDRASGPPNRVPRQLPAEVADFAGRATEIDELISALGASDPGRLGAVAICALTGPGGIGKTTLAIRVAHLVAERYPDGQLFVNLGGALAAVPASEILARLLRDLGIPDAVIPAAEAERAARYRSLLAGRKMLVVLDDARDAGQVRPLLPGTGGSAVIVTSRGTLAGVAGVKLTGLAPLDKDTSRTLLVAIVGERRTTADPEGTDGVLTSCGGLPLALRIAGSRLATRPEWTTGWLSALLASQQRRLAELTTGDLSVQASLEVSYRALPADAARMFRLFGLTRLEEVSLDAVAALTGLPGSSAASAADVLLDVHLLETVAADRLTFHDLLRLYAAERAVAEESEENIRAALRRVFTWYLHSVHAAVAILGKLRQPFALTPLPAGVRPATFGDLTDALAWLSAERINLIAAVSHASSVGLDVISHQLARLLRGFLEWSGYWKDLVAVTETGLAAARISGDKAAAATLLNILGCAHWKLGQLDMAISHLRESLAVSREIGDRELQSMALTNLGHAESDAGMPASAIGRLTEALSTNREIGNLTFEGYILHNLGHVYLATGDLDMGLEYLQKALEIRVSLHALNDQAATLHSIGDTLLRLARVEEAVEHLERALKISTANGMRYGEGLTLASLGDGLHALGKTAEARTLWQRAYDVLSDLGAAEAEVPLARLRGHQWRLAGPVP